MQKTKLVILGATGSIGDSTLQVVRANSSRLEIVGIAANSNWEELLKISYEFNVSHIAIYDEKAFNDAKSSGQFAGKNLYKGEEGLCEISVLPEANMVVAAVVGTKALKPTLAAIEAGKDIALANKELLVMAGKFVTAAAKRKGVEILPLDSEHNAIFQCVCGSEVRDISKLILTASGGMFRDFTRAQMMKIRPKDALKHPNWNMGPKVTVDSSTLANKGLEVIEAKWLFGVNDEQIDVVVHRNSIVHSMVQFVDGSILAHLSPPSMTFAISHSLLYPRRGIPVMETLDFSKPLSLDFYPPNLELFPCLKHAFDALKIGGTATTVFNAANEVAVEKFMKGALHWLDIASVVGETLSKMNHIDPITLDDVLSVDADARRVATIIAQTQFAG